MRCHHTPQTLCALGQISPSLAFSLNPPLDARLSGSVKYVLPGVVLRQRFLSRDRGLSFFSHHHYARPPPY